MIETRTGLFGQLRRGSFWKSFDQGRDERLGSRRRADMQRATGAIMAAAVLAKRCGCA